MRLDKLFDTKWPGRDVMATLRLNEEQRSSLGPISLGAALGLALIWAYWPTLHEMADRWHEPVYSHGYLVPIFAVVLLWLRRRQFVEVKGEPRWPAGLALLAVGLMMRLLSAYFYFEALDEVSLLPVLAGICFLVGGVPAWRWAWPAIGFLVFMMPLPFRLEVGLAQPLRPSAAAA